MNATKTIDGRTYEETTVVLTPRMAENFLKLAQVPAERGKSDSHTEELSHEMEGGYFCFEHVNLMTAEFNGVVYRVNGQHTCWARLAKADDPAFSQKVRLLKYRVNSLEELRALYHNVDKGKIRTEKQRKLTLISGAEGFEEIPNETIARLCSGYAILTWPDFKERRCHKAREVAGLMKGDDKALCAKVGMFVTELASKREYSWVNTPAVLAAMLATFGKVSAASREFWKAVIDGTGFESVSDPRNRLRDYLLRNAKGSGRTKASVQEETLLMCLVAWNAWREGRTLQVLKLPRENQRPTVR
jgi:hypothetical protein